MKRKQIARIDLSDPNSPKLKYDAKLMKEDLKAFKEGTRVVISIETYYRKRTVEQNRVLWWYIDEVSTETGMSKDEVKDFFDGKYLKVEIRDENDEIRCDRETGEVMTRIKSTTELSTIEFNTYTEQIRLYCNDFFGFSLPLPNEQPELKFKDME